VSEFLSMGGYAKYVWGAYGITAVVLVFNLMAAARRHREVLDRLATPGDDGASS
jgi:heme exporter protein D